MAPELFAYREYYTPPVKASLLANLQFDAPGVADLFGRTFSPGRGADPAARPSARNAGLYYGSEYLAGYMRVSRVVSSRRLGRQRLVMRPPASDIAASHFADSVHGEPELSECGGSTTFTFHQPNRPTVPTSCSGYCVRKRAAANPPRGAAALFAHAMAGFERSLWAG